MVSEEDRELAEWFMYNFKDTDLEDDATEEVRNAAKRGYLKSELEPDGINIAFYRFHAERLGYTLGDFIKDEESGTWRARITGSGVPLISPDPSKLVYGNGPEDAAAEKL